MNSVFRLAFPDEIARANSLLMGHPVPAQAQFLLEIKKKPIERIIGCIAFWTNPTNHKALHFHPAIAETSLEEATRQLAKIADESNCNALAVDFPLADESPLSIHLKNLGFEVFQTDLHYTVPAPEVIQRTSKIYARRKTTLPPLWHTRQINGNDVEAVFEIVLANDLMNHQQFTKYWNISNQERFETPFSQVLLDDEKIIGVFLVSKRNNDELHIHAEACHLEYSANSALISLVLRNASFSNCHSEFPRIFSLRADSRNHLQTQNSVFRHGGTKSNEFHRLRKTI